MDDVSCAGTSVTLALAGEFEYIFDAQKLIKDKVPNPSAFVKGEFQKFFKNNTNAIFETIWGNTKLRESLFGVIPENQLDALYNSKLNQFSTWVDDLNPKIYNFIKAE